MGISLILFVYAWPSLGQSPGARDVVPAMMCFLSAVLATFVTKMVFVIFLWSWDEVLIYWNALNLRVSSGLEGQIDANEIQAMAKIGLDPFSPSWNRGIALIYGAGKILQNASITGLGSRPLGAVLLVIGGISWLLVPILTPRFLTQFKAQQLFASGVIIPAWFVVFTNHTIVHAQFMGRLAIWPGIVATTYYLSGDFAFHFKSGLK